LQIPYSRTIPVEKALEIDTLIAWRMNDISLLADHGSPLRALVPGWYAMDSVKWLTRIEALTEPDRSFFMTQRYIGIRLQALGTERFPITELRVKSQISRPRAGELLRPEPYVLSGAAWAGNVGVDRVEVSADGGKRWTATSVARNNHSQAWVLWEMPFTPTVEGDLGISVRAWDGRGAVQPMSREPGRMDGYELNWVQTVRCKVSARP
jgi:DMSO/TMAO reductase YedYZ molybdopterin-dependent catalytic subunit